MVPAEVIERMLEVLEGRVRIRIAVKPDSPRTALVLEGDELVFYTSEPSVAGRDNASLIGFLSRVLGVSGGGIEIVGGARGGVKVVEIRGLDPEIIASRLAEVAEAW